VTLHSKHDYGNTTKPSKEPLPASFADAAALIMWLLAGAVAFLPFAVNTSPFDAVTLRVPSNQGNWWHVLVGLPFFLAFPMVWIRLRALFSRPAFYGKVTTRLIWSAVGICVLGTVLVELPFVFHLAGTSQWQRATVIGLGLGVVIASSAFLLRYRHRLSPTRAFVIGLDSAYLANAALCLVVYASAPGNIWSRLGWLVTVVVVWPIAFELMWAFGQAVGAQRHPERVV
jgi:hypothetical protein